MAQPSTLIPIGMDAHIWRRAQIATLKESFAPAPVTIAEYNHVNSLTKGESFNFDLIERLIGRALTDNYRARLGY